MLLVALCAATTMSAHESEALNERKSETVRVRPIEYEMHLGASQPLGSKIAGTDRDFGATIGCELRYNFKDSPFDVGVTIDVTTAWYNWMLDEEYDCTQSNRTVFYGVTGDYNFGQGRAVNPFVGLGLGVGSHLAILDELDDTNDGRTTAMIMPRVGVELWRHLRLTLAANLSCKYYHNATLTVGYVIGGGRKK